MQFCAKYEMDFDSMIHYILLKSSLFETKKNLPQNDSSGSEKHRPDFACSTFRMDLSEQGENFCREKMRFFF